MAECAGPGGGRTESRTQAFDDRLGTAHAYGYIVAAVSVGYVASEILTGYMRSQSVARRSVGLSFIATGGAMYLLSHATTAPIAYLALFLFGASDGVTEVVRELVMAKTPRRTLRGVVTWIRLMPIAAVASVNEAASVSTTRFVSMARASSRRHDVGARIGEAASSGMLRLSTSR
jgi:hypothetical protein